MLASYVDAIAGNESLTRYVHEVVIAQTTAAKSFTKGLGAEMARAAGVTEEVVDLLRMLAPYSNMLVQHTNPDGTETEMSAFESLKLLFREERRQRSLKQRFGASGVQGEVAEQLLFSVLQEAKEGLLSQMPDNPTEQDLREHERRLDLLDSLMNNGTMDSTIATYGRFQTPADRYQLHSYVFENRGILQAAPTNKALRDLLAGGWVDSESGLPNLDDSAWESIAKSVVSYELDRQYGIAVPTLGPDTDVAAFVGARIDEGADFVKLIVEDLGAFGPARLPTLSPAQVAPLWRSRCRVISSVPSAPGCRLAPHCSHVPMPSRYPVPASLRGSRCRGAHPRIEVPLGGAHPRIEVPHGGAHPRIE